MKRWSTCRYCTTPHSVFWAARIAGQQWATDFVGSFFASASVCIFVYLTVVGWAHSSNVWWLAVNHTIKKIARFSALVARVTDHYTGASNSSQCTWNAQINAPYSTISTQEISCSDLFPVPLWIPAWNALVLYPQFFSLIDWLIAWQPSNSVD